MPQNQELDCLTAKLTRFRSFDYLVAHREVPTIRLDQVDRTEGLRLAHAYNVYSGRTAFVWDRTEAGFTPLTRQQVERLAVGMAQVAE